MKNRPLRYLLHNDPDKVLSRCGIRFRRFINPLLRALAPSFCAVRLHVVKRSSPPSGVPLIFASTHGFKDDITLATCACNCHAYILFGSLPNFFGTINGWLLWLNGVLLVDRKRKDSRAAARQKMLRALEIGVNLLVFPEGVWNKTPNKCVQKLFPGIYDIAMESGALVVPIGSIQQGKDAYAAVGEAFDITKFERLEGIRELRDRMASLKYDLMAEYCVGARDDFGHGDETAAYWDGELNKLIASAGGYYDHEYESVAHFRDKGEADEREVFETFLGSGLEKHNALALARLCREAPWLC